LERQAEALLDEADALLVLAALRSHDTLRGERPGAQVDALRVAGVRAGHANQLERLRVASRELEVVGGPQPVAGGACRIARGRGRLGRAREGLDRPGAVALDGADAGQPA